MCLVLPFFAILLCFSSVSSYAQLIKLSNKAEENYSLQHEYSARNKKYKRSSSNKIKKGFEHHLHLSAA